MVEDTNDDFVEAVGEMIIYSAGAAVDTAALAAAVKSLIRNHYGGARVRIRKPSKHYENRQGIKAAFDGTNVAEVMERYGVSRATVYRIVNE